MKSRNFLTFLLITVLACVLPGGLRAAESDEKAKIEGLIQHVEGLTGAHFIRNGSSYDAKSAGKFLRGKWQAKDKEVKTAADFIEKIATISSTTGNPYLIRFSDGREVKCGEYLKEQLKK